MAAVWLSDPFLDCRIWMGSATKTACIRTRSTPSIIYWNASSRQKSLRICWLHSIQVKRPSVMPFMAITKAGVPACRRSCPNSGLISASWSMLSEARPMNWSIMKPMTSSGPTRGWPIRPAMMSSSFQAIRI